MSLSLPKRPALSGPISRGYRTGHWPNLKARNQKRNKKKKQLIPKLVVKQGNGRHYLLRD